SQRRGREAGRPPGDETRPISGISWTSPLVRGGPGADRDREVRALQGLFGLPRRRLRRRTEAPRSRRRLPDSAPRGRIRVRPGASKEMAGVEIPPRGQFRARTGARGGGRSASPGQRPTTHSPRGRYRLPAATPPRFQHPYPTAWRHVVRKLIRMFLTALAPARIAACLSTGSQNPPQSITLSITPDRLAPGGTATLTLRNGSEETVGYNLCASSPFRQAGADAWESVPEDRFCTNEP